MRLLLILIIALTALAVKVGDADLGSARLKEADMPNRDIWNATRAKSRNFGAEAPAASTPTQPARNLRGARGSAGGIDPWQTALGPGMSGGPMDTGIANETVRPYEAPMMRSFQQAGLNPVRMWLSGGMSPDERQQLQPIAAPPAPMMPAKRGPANLNLNAPAVAPSTETPWVTDTLDTDRPTKLGYVPPWMLQALPSTEPAPTSGFGSSYGGWGRGGGWGAGGGGGYSDPWTRYLLGLYSWNTGF